MVALINHLLTYLFTYLLDVHVDPNHSACANCPPT